MKQSWPAPERNKGPILDVLFRVLPSTGTVLEIASGSGQHAEHFARHLPSITWIPSDITAEALGSIAAWGREAELANLSAPVEIDVRGEDWGVATVDAVYCANMIHIAPWECATALLCGASRHLRLGGILVLYGPFRIGGKPTSQSNEDFDRGLRERDPLWGVRDLEEVIAEGGRSGLRFVERVSMPANNQIAAWERV